MDYNITYRDKDGGIQAIISYKKNNAWKQKSKQGFKKKGDAKTWAQSTVDNLKESFEADIDIEMEGTTLEELYNMAIKHFELYLEAGTILTYDEGMVHFAKLNKKVIADITSLEIQECIDNMVKKGLKSRTINGYVSKLKIVLDYAVEPHKIIRVNPACSIKVPKDKEKKNRTANIKALNADELQDLISKIERDDLKMISIIASTAGLRIGEIVGLTWDCHNYQKSELKVYRQWKVTNKNKDYGFGKVKTPNSVRTIPLSDATNEAIKKYKDEHPISISSRIFPFGTTANAKTTMRYNFNKVGYKISIHDLRHTYASRLVGNGVDFKTVAELIGDTVQVVIDTYSHFTGDMMENAKKAVNYIF
ncbi:MAG: site-specific recombinase, phage integrase family [Bacillota bacterium]|nr:site-specific recombinase, phage integrase family [Bacillota bacterium]